MATDSISGRPSLTDGAGSWASVYAASRMRFAPVKSRDTVSTLTTLAPRSAKYWRNASSSSR